MSGLQPSDLGYAERIRASFALQGAMQTIGVVLEKLAPGEIVLAFSANQAFSQQHGFMHAGIITTVVDSACGYAAYTLMPAGSEVLTIEYKVNFMSPAQGERFRCTGRVLKAGRTLTVCNGEVVAISAGREQVVAVMQATMICLQG